MLVHGENLDVIPGGILHTLDVSQYDNGSRTLSFTLKSRLDPTWRVPSGVTAEIRGTKPDGNVFSYEATVADNVVSCDVTPQMTAVAGIVTCEVVLLSGDKTLSTASFLLRVKPAAMDISTMQSDSELLEAYLIMDRTDEIIAVANQISNVISGKDLLDKTKITTGKQLRYETGSIADNASYFISDYIPVLPGMKIVLNWTFATAKVGHLFFDAKKTARVSDSAWKYTMQSDTFPVPAGAAYLRVTGQIEQLDTSAVMQLAPYVERIKSELSSLVGELAEALAAAKADFEQELAEQQAQTNTRIDDSQGMAVHSAARADEAIDGLFAFEAAFDAGNLINLNDTDLQDGRYLRTASMESVAADTAYFVSGYMAVIPGWTIMLNWTYDSGAVGHVFYRHDKTPLSAVAMSASSFKVPAGAAYLRVTGLSARKEISVVRCVSATLEASRSQSEGIYKSLILDNLFTAVGKTSPGLLQPTYKIRTDREAYFVSDYIPVLPGATVEINWSLDSAGYGHGFYDEDRRPLINEFVVSSSANTQVFTVPLGAAYVRLSGRNADIDGYTMYQTPALIKRAEKKAEDAYELARSAAKTLTKSWLAIGDSLTAGVYSQTSGDADDETVSPLSRETGWAHLAAGENGYIFLNGGFRGTGYVQTGAASGRSNPQWTIDSGSSARLAPSEIWSSLPDGPFDLVTVALGVNDYNNNIPLGGANSVAGDGSIRGGIKTAIEAVKNKYPGSRVVFVTPLDCVVAAAGYPRGKDAEKHGRTLTDVADAIREECAIYDIEVVDATAESPLRDWNIQQMLPDRVHPSLSCHRILAGWLGQKLGL